MAHDVFVSYASGDKPVADAVCGALESKGIRCWIAPRDVLPGMHYGEAITEAILECRIVVLVFSSKANTSGHIPKEIERAVSKGITVMPLRIEDVLPAKSLDYFIGSVHWLDALTPPLEAHLKKLAENVSTLLARNPRGPEIITRPPFVSSPAPAANAPVAPIPVAAPSPAAPRQKWTYAVITVLIAVILVLGFVLYRSLSHGPTPPPLPNANSPETQPTSRVIPNAGVVAPEPKGKSAAVTHTSTPAGTVPNKSKDAAQPPAQPVRPNVTLHQVPGSSVKLEQIIGDVDNQLHQPTRSQTFTRYQLRGADLGISFEHQGHTYFLFGHPLGRAGRLRGAMATTDAVDPELGVRLDFLAAGGKYIPVETSGTGAESYQVPVAGISLGDQMYVAVEVGSTGDSGSSTLLTKFTAPANFQSLRTVSKLPGGRFLRMSVREQPGPMAGLPSGGPFVILWGTGAYRASDVYLSIVPVAEFETGKGTQYFAGLGPDGSPIWSEKESDAKAVVKDGSLGDISVTWCKDLGMWLMTYDRRTMLNGIAFSYSRTPWGPWSDPQVIFNPVRDGAFGKFIHNPNAKQDDGLSGPVFGAKFQNNPQAVHGAAFAPYMVERWTKVEGNVVNLYYTMSTGNPYVVVLMKSRLDVR